MVAHPLEPLMRIVLVVYVVVAGAAAVDLVSTPWFVLHAAGAAAGVCALGLAVRYAGLVGEAERDLYREEGR